MKTISLFLAVLFVMFSTNVYANDTEYPYQLSLQKEIIILGIGATFTAGAFYLKTTNDAPTRSEIERLNRNDVNWFDRSATYNYSDTAANISDYGLVTMQIAPLFLLLEGKVREHWITTYLMFLEGLVITNFALTDFTKNLVQRKRPYLYNDDVDIEDKLENKEDGARSFFSGHTSYCFYSATFISKVFSDLNPDSKYKYLVWGSTHAIAATVGYMRYKAGRHYPSDVLVGAAVGSLVGYFIPELHRVANKDVTFNPIIINNFQGAAFTFCY